ncbi:hypothetical protein FQN55_007639 [Onygenales sp. PD_40]|nr:hypothetical protein FQN55_007639 [Onygenales sp. PD_40]KAK2782484.1 hypothetical protein FQN53_009723 [Emmonsiellopsis sp. PD_33]KAK2794171.1 hypothetical protein FQN52_009253 [Onygenales sp. PD_12]KAK2794243.1 hypothetical protein FQN51_000877 [Onygenales sp. PD_10]
MGYSEILCHFCGVSFNIARSRRVGEPRSASWNYYGGYDEEEEWNWPDCALNGCCLAVRKRPKKDENNDEETAESAPLAAPEKEIIIQIPRDENPFDNIEGELGGYKIDSLEHIAGPGCKAVNAYSGYNISLEEMKFCCTVQCLVYKDQSESQKLDALAQDWEQSGEYFLSGLCDQMPSRDDDCPEVFPTRGGVVQPWADNIIWDDEQNYAVPFHPWCFDIFSRLSKLHFGHVNVPGLMEWRNAESSYEDFNEFPHGPDVEAGQEQWWCHEPGKEYLAANPLYVPNLPAILRSAIKNDEDNFSSQNSAFSVSQPTTGSKESQGTAEYHSRTDPLQSLPQEIRLLIIDQLPSRDIANLRLASRAFRQLPISLWYHLVREEMPWLWEAWDDGECDNHTPSFWTTNTAADLSRIMKGSPKSRNEITAADIVASGTAMPEQIKLPRDKTNWYQLYVEIRRNWGQLKGLQNRERIYKDVEEIIRRIEEYEWEEEGEEEGDSQTE